ncbi:hypothetical protein A2783_01535 [Microgenomates group bacterium RIFCSPHIGHO2_01_FULL_45_11]|nr:MAG: hypothetical protein A2783_01535 [Microgenomates group bacterium RIFCSPHIGHO2_01_FULL_45_11]
MIAVTRKLNTIFVRIILVFVYFAGVGIAYILYRFSSGFPNNYQTSFWKDQQNDKPTIYTSPY